MKNTGTFEDFLKNFFKCKTGIFTSVICSRRFKTSHTDFSENLNLKLKDDPRWINHHEETWKKVLEE